MSDPQANVPNPADDELVKSDGAPAEPDAPAADTSLAENAGATATSEAERYPGAVPPGYDWPTHGGYLGCLMGVVFALVLAPLGYIVFGFLGASLAISLGSLGVGLAAAITIVAYIAAFIALSRAGWRLGKHFLREYPQPNGPTWGESDAFVQLAASPAPGDQALAEE